MTLQRRNIAFFLAMNQKLIIDVPFYTGEADYGQLAQNIRALDPAARIDWLADCRLVQIQCTCDPDLILVAVLQTGLIPGSIIGV